MKKIQTVCVYCAASNRVDPTYKEAAKRLGILLAQINKKLIFGGGNVGLMKIIADAVVDNGGQVMGVLTQQLKEYEGAYEKAQEFHVVDSMHARKSKMEKNSDAFIILPGGFGTLDELFEIITWRQIGLHKKNIIVVNINNYWDPLISLMHNIVDNKFATAADIQLVNVVSSVDEAVQLILDLAEDVGIKFRESYRYSWVNSALIRRVAIGLMALLPLAGCQMVREWWYPEAEEEISPWHEHAIIYYVNLIGDFPEELTEQLREISHLVTLQEKQPLISLIALRRRANEDIDNLKMLLKARGYLDASVSADISGEESPYTVNININAGIRYSISGIYFHNTQEASVALVSPADLSHWVHVGEPMETQAILTLQQLLTLYLQGHGYPGAQVEEPKIAINRYDKTVAVHVSYNPGHLSEFGTCEIIGLKNLDATYINNRLAWKEGQTYDQKLVEETRSKLINSAIFDSVTIRPQDPQQVPTSMVVELAEAPPRVIGAGLRYFSSEGLGAKVFWRHYNAWNGGELIDASVQVSQRLNQLRLGAGFPDVLAPEQQLQTLLTIARERTKAYNAKTIEAELKIQRPLTKNITGSIGVLFEAGHVERGFQHTSERLFGLPLEMVIDTSDNPLDPRSGWWAA